MAANLINPLFWYDFYQNYDVFTDKRFWSTDLIKNVFDVGAYTTNTAVSQAISSGGIKSIVNATGLPAPLLSEFNEPRTTKYIDTLPNSTIVKNSFTTLDNCRSSCIANSNCGAIGFDGNMYTYKGVPGYVNCTMFTNQGIQNTDLNNNNPYVSYTYKGLDNSVDKKLKKGFDLQTDNKRPITMCRGTGWQDNGGPVYNGRISADQCAVNCFSDPSCKAFDIARKDSNNNFDCWTFKHSNIDNVKGVTGDLNNAGCFKKIYDINAYTQRIYTKNNWLVYQGTSGNMNPNWKSGTYLYSNDTNNAAQVSKIVGDGAYNKGSIVSIIFDIGTWNFESVDLYIKFDYTSSTINPSISPIGLYGHQRQLVGQLIDEVTNKITDEYADVSRLELNSGIFNNFPIVTVGTHNIWTNPTTVFSINSKLTLPPNNIGISYVSCPEFTESRYAYPPENKNSEMYPLSVIKTKYPNNIFTSSLYVINNKSRIFKITVKSKDIPLSEQKRYLVISHSAMLQSSFVDIVFNPPKVNVSGQILYNPLSDPNSSLFYNPQWKQINGNLKQVEIDNNIVCGINNNDDIFCADNDVTNPQWKQVPGKLKHITVNGNKLYGTNTYDEIFTADYKTDTSQIKWTKVNGGLKQVDLSDNVVCGTNKYDEMFCANSNIYSNYPNWTKIPGGLKHITISGNKLYGTNTYDEIFTADYKTDISQIKWTKVNGKLKQVDLNNNIACGVNNNDDIFCSDINSDYQVIQQIPGKLKYVSVNNRRIYGVNSGGDIFTSKI